MLEVRRKIAARAARLLGIEIGTRLPFIPKPMAWEAWFTIQRAAKELGLREPLKGYIDPAARTLSAMSRAYVLRYVQHHGPVKLIRGKARRWKDF